MMRSRRIHYSGPELAWIKRASALPRKEAHRLFCEKFGRDEVTLVHFTSLCKRKGWLTGRTPHVNLMDEL